MTTFLVGTDATATSETLADYLEGRAADDDTVIAVNSHPGGDATDETDIAAGTEALDVLAERVGADTHQLVRGNSPQEDLLAFAAEHDADELVIGVRKRSPTGKMLFGSTAQDLLLSSDRPILAVPLTEST